LEQFSWKAFVDKRVQAIYRKFRTDKPDEATLLSNFNIFALLNKLHTAEVDSTVNNACFDWSVFQNGPSKKENKEYLGE